MSNAPKVPKARTTVRFAAVADEKAKNPDIKGPGSKKGRPKTPGSGKKKGTMNSATLEREQNLANALIAEFEKLTPAEAEAITPMEVMRLCTISAVKLGNWGLSLMAAEKWAPYVHPKLAAVMHHNGDRRGDDIDGDIAEDDEFGGGGDPGLRVRIVGGLPDLNPKRPAKDAEVVEPEPTDKK